MKCLFCETGQRSVAQMIKVHNLILLNGLPEPYISLANLRVKKTYIYF